MNKKGDIVYKVTCDSIINYKKVFYLIDKNYESNKYIMNGINIEFKESNNLNKELIFYGYHNKNEVFKVVRKPITSKNNTFQKITGNPISDISKDVLNLNVNQKAYYIFQPIFVDSSIVTILQFDGKREKKEIISDYKIKSSKIKVSLKEEDYNNVVITLKQYYNNGEIVNFKKEYLY